MVDTIKFSQMTNGGDINNDNQVPGLLGGANVLFNNPWTFLPPGTTAQRPTPSATINYRLRFNTEDQLYEYYDAILGLWTQLQESAFTVGPFVTYTADVSLPDAQNLGLLADGILRQTISAGIATLDIAVNEINFYGPGMVGFLKSPQGIKDSNGNIVVYFQEIASAVNYIEFLNNSTGNVPIIIAAGIDLNVGLLLAGKNEGGIGFSTQNTSLPFNFYSGTGAQHVTNFAMANTAANRTVTWQDADGTIAFVGDIPTGEPLSAVNDTNVTLTLGGSPLTALINAASITAGWTGQLDLSRGGTNANLTASNGGIVWSNASQMQILAGTATANKVLLSGSSTTPAWSTATYPDVAGAAGKIIFSDGTNFILSTPLFPNASATAGKMIISGGVNWIASTSIWPNSVATVGKILRSNGTTNTYTTATFADTYTASNLLFSNGANTVTGLATANDGVLVTSGAGVPSISSTLPTGLAMQTPASLVLTNATGLPVAGGGTGAASLTGLLTGNGTSAFTGTAITQYNVLTGGASNLPNSVAPSATSGVPLISQGAASQPVFGTAVVEGGGTGNSTFTAYSVICAGTTATGAFQNVSGVGTTDQILKSNGAAALPSWTDNTSIKSVNIVLVQGTAVIYTPTANTKYIIVELIGGGGGAGAITGGTAGQGAISGGGAGGGYVRRDYSLVELGVDAEVTTGAGGTGGTGAGTGGTGGSSTFIPGGSGVTLTATGGVGGAGMSQSAAFQIAAGGNPGGAGTNGGLEVTGSDGVPGMSFAAAAGVYGGAGGGSFLCPNSYMHGNTTGGGSGGTRADCHGQGASGRFSVGAGGSTGNGQPGNPGICVITEFIS